MDPLYQLLVVGPPVAQGSLQSSTNKQGYSYVYQAQKVLRWRELAMIAHNDKYNKLEPKEIIRGSVLCRMTATYKRPKSHLTATGQINATGKTFPYPSRNDTDKVCRATGDFLEITAKVIHNDRQISCWIADSIWGDQDAVDIQLFARTNLDVQQQTLPLLNSLS